MLVGRPSLHRTNSTLFPSTVPNNCGSGGRKVADGSPQSHTAISLNLVPVDNFAVYYSSAAVKKPAVPSAVKPAIVGLRRLLLRMREATSNEKNNQGDNHAPRFHFFPLHV